MSSVHNAKFCERRGQIEKQNNNKKETRKKRKRIIRQHQNEIKEKEGLTKAIATLGLCTTSIEGRKEKNPYLQKEKMDALKA